MPQANSARYCSRMAHMWADTLQVAEKAHLLRMLVWSALSILAGTAVLAWLRASLRQSDLLRHFAIQTLGWGVAVAAISAVMWARLGPRDLSAATRLDRLIWLNIGLDGGFVLVGLTLAVSAWRLGPRLAVVGAGIGIVVQGCALALLNLVIAAQISR